MAKKPTTIEPDIKRVTEIMQKLQNDPAFLAAIERAVGTEGPSSGRPDICNRCSQERNPTG